MIIKAFLRDSSEGRSFTCPRCNDEDYPIVIAREDGDLPYCIRCGARYRYDVLKIDEKKEKIEVLMVDWNQLENEEEPLC